MLLGANSLRLILYQQTATYVGVERFHFDSENQRPLRACSYMDFCCDGNVTLDVTVICCVGSMA